MRMKLRDFIRMYRYDNITKYQPISKKIWIIYYYLFPKLYNWERSRLEEKKKRDGIKNATNPKYLEYQEYLKTCIIKPQQ